MIECVYVTGGMTVKGRTRSARRKNCPNSIFFQQKSHIDWHGIEFGRAADLFELLPQHLQVSTYKSD